MRWIRGLVVAVVLVVTTASALPTDEPALPVAAVPEDWSTLADLSARARQTGDADAAIAWMEAAGPREAPIPEGAPVAAVLSIARDWVRRGAERIQDSASAEDRTEGILDLANALRHGAAVGRHSHTLSDRVYGAAIQDEVLTTLENLELDALYGTEQAELLMALGEAEVLPPLTETLRRHCDRDRERLAAIADQVAWTLRDVRFDHHQTRAWLDAACAAAEQSGTWTEGDWQGRALNPIGAALLRRLTAGRSALLARQHEQDDALRRRRAQLRARLNQT